MEFSPKQQAVNLISNAKDILLVTHQNPDSDAIGSLLGLSLALKKLNKNVHLSCADPAPKNLSFLPGVDLISSEVRGKKDFIINLNCAHGEVEKLGYKLENNVLKIVITPKSGYFENEDVSIEAGKMKFDLVVVLDTPDFERLGDLYDQNSPVFYEAPIINIDHHPTNTYFGKVNLVDLTATSTAEILIAMLEALEKEEKILNEDIATCLLTGIIGDTNSFQNANTTPKSLTCAAQLLAAGAKQQEIVRHLFKTKPLSTLRLWGRILDKIEMDAKYRFVYSVVSKEDLEQAGAKEENFAGAIDELLRSAQPSDLALLLSEREKGVSGSLRAIDPNVDCVEIARTFGGGGHKGAAAFLIPGQSLEQVKERVLERIREYQRNRLSLD